MLKQIALKNFKRFERFSVHCREANILVGPNNSGKSSILDSLRILYGAHRYARRLKPRLVRIRGGEAWGYEIPDTSIPIALANVVHNYDDEDAVLEFHHDNGRVLVVEIHPERITRLYLRDASRRADTGPTYFRPFPVDVIIVPTLSPFEENERYVNDETIERNRAGRLSSRHFRNLWYRNREEFPRFSNVISETWPGITLGAPDLPLSTSHTLEMFYKEGIYPRELAWSGFGFQVWLQIVSHAFRGNEKSIFVLDEPDIYLHADLQHKLLGYVKESFCQFFLATHSPEIINRASPGDIVSINSSLRSGKRVRSDDEYNEVFSRIGSIENVELSKLSRARRVIFFEGKDKSILSKFAKKAGLDALITDADTLVIQVGGFGQWRRVTEAAWTFRKVLQIDVQILAIFDRDYRDDDEIALMCEQMSSKEVGCVVWGRKEIENYALNVEVLVRAIMKRLSGVPRADLVSCSNITSLVSEISERYRHDVHAQITSNTMRHERSRGSKKDDSQIIMEANKRFEYAWADLPRRLRIVPGKQFIADVSTELQKAYGTTVTLNMIIDEFRSDELDPEMVMTLGRIDGFVGGVESANPRSEDEERIDVDQ